VACITSTLLVPVSTSRLVMSQSQVFSTEPVRVGIVSIYAPSNFIVLLGSLNKGRANVEGFAVYRVIFVYC